MEPPPSSLSPHHCGLATTFTMELPPLLWSRRRCRGAATIVVVDTPLLSSLSCRRCCGAAVIIVEPSLLLWSRCYRKTKKKKTKKKKKKKKTKKKKKKKQSLRSHYNMLKEFATSAQSPCRQGMCCPKSPTRHQPHPTLTLTDIAYNKRYHKPD